MSTDALPILQTQRLELQPITLENSTALAAFFELYSDEKAMRYMPYLPHKTAQETQVQLFSELSRKGACFWAIYQLEEVNEEVAKPIGYVSFLGETRLPGMGYMLHPKYWGQGYVPEACREVLDFGFKTLAYDRVELWINEYNAASIRVAQKLGFGLKGSIQQKYSFETKHHTMLVYGMLANEWLDSQVLDIEVVSNIALYTAEPVLMVHDVKATANYYKDKLGFSIDFIFGEPADHASVSRSEWTGKGVVIQLTRVPQERDIKPASYLHILMSTNIDKLFEAYSTVDIEIISQPQNQPWGMREFTIRDLNGHVLVFATHL